MKLIAWPFRSVDWLGLHDIT